MLIWLHEGVGEAKGIIEKVSHQGYGRDLGGEQMILRTKGEQKAYLDGYERCAECIKKYLSDKGKKILECQLMAVRNAVEIEDIEPQESEDNG